MTSFDKSGSRRLIPIPPPDTRGTFLSSSWRPLKATKEMKSEFKRGENEIKTFSLGKGQEKGRKALPAFWPAENENLFDRDNQ